MKKLRELFSDTLIYGISSVLARFINYLLVPLYTDVFSPAKYGIVGLMYAGISFLNVIFTFGMESAYLRYAENRKEAANIFKTLQLGLLGFATLLCAILWLAMPVLLPLFNLGPESSGIFLLMLGILWFDTLSIVPMAELRLVRRSWLFASLKFLNVIINLGLNLYLILGLNFGIEAVFISNLAASMIMTLLVWACTASLLKGKWNSKWMKTAFEFGWPFVPSGIGYAINEMLDRFLLNNMDPANTERIYGAGTSPEDIVGIYNACYKMAVFMLLVVQMYRMAWQPFFMRHGNDKNSPKLFGQAFIWFNGFAALLFLVVALFKEQIVAIQIPGLNATLIGSDYWAGLEIVPFLLLAYWFHGWYINFSSGVFIKERTKVLYKITLMGAVITILSNLALIPLLGMTGSAIATLLSYGAMAGTLGIFSKKIMDVPYRLPESFGLMAVLAFMVLGSPIIIEWTGAEELAGKVTILIAGILITTGYLWKFIDRESE
ncbi:MAG: oligosaccharide flippase family protein [Balneolaceae bacterium]|nr:oligosaccharide flippase family protein [Balneolaceae bacterium]